VVKKYKKRSFKNDQIKIRDNRSRKMKSLNQEEGKSMKMEGLVWF